MNSNAPPPQRSAVSKLKSFLRLGARTYLENFAAVPIGIGAALISTFGAATIMLLVEKILLQITTNSKVVVICAVVGPLIAYVLYLASYYSGMFLKDQRGLREDGGCFDKNKLGEWFRVVKYDYLGHLPSDIYLITSAGLLQAAIHVSGASIFVAVFFSQLADDFFTFLKEPAIWGAAKGLASWEHKRRKSLFKVLYSYFKHDS